MSTLAKCPGPGGLGGTPTQAVGASFWPRQEPKFSWSTCAAKRDAEDSRKNGVSQVAPGQTIPPTDPAGDAQLSPVHNLRHTRTRVSKISFLQARNSQTVPIPPAVICLFNLSSADLTATREHFVRNLTLVPPDTCRSQPRDAIYVDRPGSNQCAS
jgi:hypothetical protein